MCYEVSSKVTGHSTTLSIAVKYSKLPPTVQIVWGPPVVMHSLDRTQQAADTQESCNTVRRSAESKWVTAMLFRQSNTVPLLPSTHNTQHGNQQHADQDATHADCREQQQPQLSCHTIRPISSTAQQLVHHVLQLSDEIRAHNPFTASADRDAHPPTANGTMTQWSQQTCRHQQVVPLSSPSPRPSPSQLTGLKQLQHRGCCVEPTTASDGTRLLFLALFRCCWPVDGSQQALCKDVVPAAKVVAGPRRPHRLVVQQGGILLREDGWHERVLGATATSGNIQQ